MSRVVCCVLVVYTFVHTLRVWDGDTIGLSDSISAHQQINTSAITMYRLQVRGPCLNFSHFSVTILCLKKVPTFKLSVTLSRS